MKGKKSYQEQNYMVHYVNEYDDASEKMVISANSPAQAKERLLVMLGAGVKVTSARLMKMKKRRDRCHK